MSRILAISQLPPPIHGSTIMTKIFLQTLDGLGHEWRLVDRRFSVSVGQVGKFSIRKVLAAGGMVLRLFTTVRRFDPDVVVFFTTNRPFSFLVDWVLSEVLRIFRVRQVNYVHTVGYVALAERNRIFEWMVSRLLGSAETTVCLGPTLATDVTLWVSESKISIIPNAVEDRPIALGERESNARTLVLYLSNLIPEKGADTFVDLAIELAPEFPHVEFVVAGATANQSFTDSLIAKVEAADASTSVLFPGAIVDSREKWKLLDDAAVLVFPSTYPFEAQPLTILEALSAGTPVVAYDVGGIGDVLGGLGDEYLVGPKDIRSLVRSVRGVLRGTASASTSQLSKRFSRGKYADLWSSVLG